MDPGLTELRVQESRVRRSLSHTIALKYHELVRFEGGNKMSNSRIVKLLIKIPQNWNTSFPCNKNSIWIWSRLYSTS